LGKKVKISGGMRVILSFFGVFGQFFSSCSIAFCGGCLHEEDKTMAKQLSSGVKSVKVRHMEKRGRSKSVRRAWKIRGEVVVGFSGWAD